MRSRTPHALLATVAALAVLLGLALTPTPGRAAADPGRPRDVDVDVRSGGLPGFTLRWVDPVAGAPDAYEVLVDGVVQQTVDGGVRKALVAPLRRGLAYRVAVRAVADDVRGEAVGQSLVLTFGPATPVLAANPDNPLAGHEWGTYLGRADDAYEPWLRATGATKEAIGQITLQPKAKWFGRWIPDGDIARKVDDYIAESTHGDPDVLTQMTLFRMDPWEGEACKRLPTDAEVASYRTWVRRAAGAIGDALVAVVLQPDGPFARCAPGGSTLPSRLIAWTARLLEALPRTSVYVDMGSPGWFRDDITQAVQLLVRAGVADARGFALSITHMDTTRQSVRFGARIVDALAERGIDDVHFVVDTADNGRGFSGAQFRKVYPRSVSINHTEMCRTPTQRLCVALGAPPTTDVAHPRWGLPPEVRALAAERVDGYLWINRPWLDRQIAPFMVSHAVELADQNPYD